MGNLDLYEQMLLAKGIKPKEQLVEKGRPETGPYNLSFAQKRMWFLQMFDPDSYSYHITSAIRIEGNLEVSLLEVCFNEVIKRHEILRTYFIDTNDGPKQVIEDSLQFTIEENDLCLSKDQNIEQQIINISQKAFNLSELPLFRITLLKVSENSYVFVLVMHHIIGDGWSTNILVKEIAHLYNIKSEERSDSLPKLKYQYADFSEWQYQFKKAGKLNEQLSYWKKNLELCNEVLELPVDKSRPAIQSGKGSLVKFELTKDLTNSLKGLSKSKGITNSILFLSCYYILLQKCTKQLDILIGTPIAGRNDTDFEELIGLFVNTIIFRINTSSSLSFKELVNHVKEIAVEAYSNQNVPLELVIEEVNPLRTTSNTPLFQVMFSFENISDGKIEINNLNITPIKIDEGFSQVDLSLSVREREGVFEGSFEYNTDIFEKWRIEKMILHFNNILEKVSNNSDIKIKELPILTSVEKNEIINVWNSNKLTIPRDKLLHELFEDQVKKTPDRIAINFNNQYLTYYELNNLSNKLSCELIKIGVKPQEIVSICLNQSVELLIAVLGILKTGAAYLPLDPAFPKSRINEIHKDADITKTITSINKTDEFDHIQNIDIESFLNNCTNEHSENNVFELDSKDIACVIYTSGTSGKPKGVLIEHINIINLVKSFIESYDSNEKDIILPVTSIASSSFVGEIFPLICCGGCLVLNNNIELLDVAFLQSIITKKQVTILSSVPSVLEKINKSRINIPSLRLILCGGEEVSVHQISELIKTKTLVNGYGITETTICSTYDCFEPGSISENTSITIGKPTINTKIYIFDNDLNALPVGYPGEIYISGDGLTRGYINNPELTVSKFINSPIIKDEKIYKTGDLASWLPNGKLKYHGRADSQVQIRGYRIELKEVEVYLKNHELIKNAIVLKRADMPGGDQLVAYIVSESNKISSLEIRNFLSGSIPNYMIPSYYEFIDKIPYNLNGKVSIDLLPKPTEENNEKSHKFENPKTETERIIANIWLKHLEKETISVSDNFFDIGGHSLLAVEVFNDLKKAFEKKITIVDLFNFPTISSLASFINNENKQKADLSKLSSRAEKRNKSLERRKQLNLKLKNRE